jgi:homoserine O-acetyltransferase
MEAFATVWTAWLFSQEWWRRELWREGAKPGATFESTLKEFRTNFIPGADANDLILQCRTWEHHDIGATPGFNGATERALRSIKAPFLYMPSPWATPAMKRRSCRTFNWCRSRRCGDTPPAPEGVRRTRSS